MSQKATQRVTDGIKTLIQPYLGKQEFGGLYVQGHNNTLPYSGPQEEDSIFWLLGYRKISGQAGLIDVAYRNQTHVFWYIDGDDEVLTPNPQHVLDFVRRRLENIKTERTQFLEVNVQMQKRNGIPMEQTIKDARVFATNNPEFGPIEEELQLYERVVHEVYQQ